MSTLDHLQWKTREQQRRWTALREVLARPWRGDRNWEGRTIGLHLPLDIRNRAIRIQERLGLRSMKETLFKALEVGFQALEELPPVTPPTKLKSDPPPRRFPPTPLPRSSQYLDPLDEDDLPVMEPDEEPPAEPVVEQPPQNDDGSAAPC